jgi:hypothetical protein
MVLCIEKSPMYSDDLNCTNYKYMVRTEAKPYLEPRSVSVDNNALYHSMNAKFKPRLKK